MKRDESLYLRHILDAISKVEEYLQDSNENDFYASSLLQDGVIRQIEINRRSNEAFIPKPARPLSLCSLGRHRRHA